MTKPYLQIPTDLVARVVHEANRVLQEQTGEEVSPPYDAAPQWQKDSAYLGIQEAVAGKNPEELHESWCEVKVQDGWVFGPVKDADKKTHPCLVPYSQLSESQRIKDHMFSAIVKAFVDAPQVIA
jgi:hypothetical protein